MIYIFAIGCYFSSSLDLQHGYGTIFLSYGLSLIFLALLSLGMIFPLKYGVDRHNRFLLAVVFIFESIVFAELINLALSIQSYTVPIFSKTLQADCLQNTPTVFSAEECSLFYNSDRSAGFRLVWAYYFSTKSDRASYQFLSTIQQAGCCGFFSPFKCSPITTNYPKSLATTGISGKFISQRVLCGPYANYYPEQDNCVSYYDFGASPPIVGGCYYDMSVAFCMTQTVEPTSIGCASDIEDYIASLVTPHVPMMLMTSVLCMFYMLISCCMWWKRKDTDVFPAFLRPTASKVQYKTVPAVFELVPSPGLLFREGFLPEENGNGTIDEEKEDSSELNDDEEAQPASIPIKVKPVT
jgi:hypothetical protein